MGGARRKLCLEAERASDDAVMQVSEPALYAGQLVSLARRMSAAQVSPALGMAKRSDLSTRVSALLDDRQRRGPASAFATGCAMAVACLILITLAPVRTVAQSGSPAAATAQDAPSSALGRGLIDAAKEGNSPAIDALINAGADVNFVLSGDGSPLIAAARNGHVEAVRLLLDQGADLMMPVRGDGSPLIMAAREGHAEVVTLLLDRGANIEQIVPEDENALIQASANGRLDVVQILVSLGADVNARAWTESNGGEWRTPLSMARRGGHEAIAALLAASGARQ